MTTVINIRQAPSGFQKKDGIQFGEYVYIGRPGYFGNPIRISGKYGNYKCSVCGKLHMDAGSTLPCYTKFLDNKCMNDAIYRNEIYKLKECILVCFCKPSPCHGDILAKYVDML